MNSSSETEADLETRAAATRMVEGTQSGPQGVCMVLRSDGHVFAIRVPQWHALCINGDGFRAISRPPLMFEKDG